MLFFDYFEHFVANHHNLGAFDFVSGGIGTCVHDQIADDEIGSHIFVLVVVGIVVVVSIAFVEETVTVQIAECEG